MDKTDYCRELAEEILLAEKTEKVYLACLAFFAVFVWLLVLLNMAG